MMTVILFIFWLVMAEFASLSEWWVGLLASIIVVVFLRQALITKEEVSPFKLFQIKYFILFFFAWLKDLWVANIEVAKIVLQKKMPIEPAFYMVKQPLKRPLNQTIFANAITLTPGTLTVDFDDETMLIHGLLPHHIEDLKNSKNWRYFEALEKDDRHA
jgi:multicomponent Na+:H+ antiporter subunit E